MPLKVLILVILLTRGAAVAQSPAVARLDATKISPAEIDTTVTKLMQSAEVPGVGVAILNDGKVVFEKAYGVRDREKNLPLTPDSVMTAASLTKAAFAYLVMQLVQQGRFDLDKPVYQYLPKPLPDYPDYNDLKNDERYKRITARMLLSHSSGFPNWRAFEPDHTLRIHFEPGTHFAYSGEGIILLQLVVETITAKNLEDLMREMVFRPLGMNRTSMVWQPQFESDFANGYDEYGRSLGPQRRQKPDAAGSMQTTLHDYSLFVAAVMSGKGLSKKTREEMLRAQIRIRTEHEFPTIQNVSTTTTENDSIHLSYGLGWGLYWTPYGEAFFKEGHDVAWRNYVVGFLKKKIGMVIMSNSANGEGIYKALLETLLRNSSTPIAWEGFTPYNQLPPRPPLNQHHRVSLDAAVLKKYVGRYGDPVNFPNVVLTIRQQEDHLSMQENDDAPQELLPGSAVDFYSTTSDDECTFVLDTAGRVSQLILHVDGKDLPVKPLE